MTPQGSGKQTLRILEMSRLNDYNKIFKRHVNQIQSYFFNLYSESSNPI